MAQLVRIDEGRTTDDVVDLLRAIEAGDGPDAPPAWLHMTGIHFSPVGPGRSAALVTELEPGSYVGSVSS